VRWSVLKRMIGAATIVAGAHVTDDPIELDEHRGMSAQKDTQIRRHLHEVQADQASLRERQSELEKFLVSAPAASWPEAAAKALYLLELFAATAEAQDPRRKKLIASVIGDFRRLTESALVRREESPGKDSPL
jgi:hypothetical protein